MEMTLPNALYVDPKILWHIGLRNGFAFARSGQQGPTASNISHVQLYNPAGSNIAIVVYPPSFSVTSADITHVKLYDTALTTFWGNGRDISRIGKTSLGQINLQDNTTAIGTSEPFGFFTAGVSPVNKFMSQIPIAFLEPGQGIHVHSTTVNLRVFAGWFWLEIPLG